jgi:uncharacterized protein (TIGR00369 family)
MSSNKNLTLFTIHDKYDNAEMCGMFMEIKTHFLAHGPLLGSVVDLIDGESATVKLVAIENMVVDNEGLVHGGFTFGLADYAAMLAVNHPNVVLASADVRFTAPVKRGEIMIAKAKVIDINERKHIVDVKIKVSEKVVFTGKFTCFVLEKHVLL